MSKYAEVIYPRDEKNQYPSKLSEHIYTRFMKEYEAGTPPKILDIGCCTGKAYVISRKIGSRIQTIILTLCIASQYWST